MKKIRGMVKFCVSVIIISIILIFSIKLDNINELLLGALLGSVISVVSTIYVEYTNFISQQRNYRDEYFWLLVYPYSESLNGIFEDARKLFNYDYIFEGISKDEGNWRAYENVYLSNKLILDQNLDSYVELIINNVSKNLNVVFNLSANLTKIERYDFFGGESECYKHAAKLYGIIENINWSLQEAYGKLLYIQNINDEIEKRCSQIIVCRWLSDLLCNNYDRGITDLTDEEEEKSYDETEYEDQVAKKDLDLAINDYVKILNDNKNLV